MVRTFVTPKNSDYSIKLRLGLGMCHLEQKTYSKNLDEQSKVGTVDRFLIRTKKILTLTGIPFPPFMFFKLSGKFLIRLVSSSILMGRLSGKPVQ